MFPPEMHAKLCVVVQVAGHASTRVLANVAARPPPVVQPCTYQYVGCTNQLTEMIPIDRAIREFGVFIAAAKSHDILILNPSDMRPAPMTTDFVFKLVSNRAR